MSQILKEVLDANAKYAATHGEKGKLPMRPARGFAILTCMDARMDPAKFAGLVEGDAHVIRNAGGRASDDAIRSLVISYKLQATGEWFVIHHTGCAQQLVTDQGIRELLASSLKPAAIGPNGWTDPGGQGSPEAEYIDWLTIRDPRKSVVADIRRIRSHPLVPPDIPIHGFLYDVGTGRLESVQDA
jgi:carbonic anhydrase